MHVSHGHPVRTYGRCEACSARSCYACTIDVSGRGQKRHVMAFRFLRYESMVEVIESLPSGSTVTRPWLAREAFDGGPDNWSIAYLVIRDMYFHGLLLAEPVRKQGNIRTYRRI